jgi:hypothetical protein
MDGPSGSSFSVSALGLRLDSFIAGYLGVNDASPVLSDAPVSYSYQG